MAQPGSTLPPLPFGSVTVGTTFLDEEVQTALDHVSSTLYDLYRRNATLENNFNELSNKFKTFGDILTEIAKENTALKERLIPIENAAFQKITSPEKDSKPKLAIPEDFDGTKEKFQDWWRAVELHLVSNPSWTDDQKLTFVLSYMKGGSAAPFADSTLRRGRTQAIQWQDFKDRLHARFDDPNKVRTAQVKLQELAQGSGRASDYVQAFETYEEDSGFNDAGLIPLFKKGLNQHVRFQVAMNTGAITLADWKEESVNTDNLICEVRADEALFHINDSKQTKSTPRPTVNPPSRTSNCQGSPEYRD